MSQLYLGDAEDIAYVERDNTNKIFIGGNVSKKEKEDPKRWADIINHEELHNTLNKEHGRMASIGLDVITTPPIYDDDDNLLNEKTQGEIYPASKVVKFAEKEIGKHEPLREYKKEMDDYVRSANKLYGDDTSKNMVWTKGLDSENISLAKGYYDEDNTDRAYEKRRVKMNPDVFLQRQFKMSSSYKRDGQSGFKKWTESVSDDVVDDYARKLKDPTEEVPTPIEVYNKQSGKLEDFQEGRHRGLAAKKAGVDVDVILARKKAAPWDRKTKDDVFSDKFGGEPESGDWEESMEEFDDE